MKGGWHLSIPLLLVSLQLVGVEYHFVDRPRLGQRQTSLVRSPVREIRLGALLGYQIGLAEQHQFPRRLPAVHTPLDLDLAAEFPRAARVLTGSFADKPAVKYLPTRIDFEKRIHAGKWG